MMKLQVVVYYVRSFIFLHLAYAVWPVRFNIGRCLLWFV